MVSNRKICRKVFAENYSGPDVVKRTKDLINEIGPENLVTIQEFPGAGQMVVWYWEEKEVEI